MWCDQFSDVGGRFIIKGGVFVTLIAIFIKKSIVFTSKLYGLYFLHVSQYKTVLVFTSNLCGKRTTHTGDTGLFFSMCSLVQNCINDFGCFVRSLVEEVFFLELNFSVMDNGSEQENFAHKMTFPRRIQHIWYKIG